VPKRSAGAQIKACEGRGREFLRLRARWRFAQDFRLWTPARFASLTPANRLKFKSARPDQIFILLNTIDSNQGPSPCFELPIVSNPRIDAPQRSAGAQIKACEGRGREFLRLRARWRFAQDFACGLPLGFASLTPANRLKFKSARSDH